MTDLHAFMIDPIFIDPGLLPYSRSKRCPAVLCTIFGDLRPNIDQQVERVDGLCGSISDERQLGEKYVSFRSGLG